MPPQDLATPPETPRDPVHISEDNAIDIDQALVIAQQEQVPLGKSTLQRWALKWKELHNDSPVKAVLWVSHTKKTYLLNREEFKVWLFERKQSMRPGETLQDPVGSRETPQDLKRPQETSRGSERFQSEREERPNNDRIRELENDNMRLTIDIKVRDQLLDRAREEMDKAREREGTMLRHIGGLELQVRQLAAPKQHSDIHGGTSRDSDHSTEEHKFTESQTT